MNGLLAVRRWIAAANVKVEGTFCTPFDLIEGYGGSH